MSIWDGIPLIYHDLIFEWHPKSYSRLGFIDPGLTLTCLMYMIHDVITKYIPGNSPHLLPPQTILAPVALHWDHFDWIYPINRNWGWFSVGLTAFFQGEMGFLSEKIESHQNRLVDHCVFLVSTA